MQKMTSNASSHREATQTSIPGRAIWYFVQFPLASYHILIYDQVGLLYETRIDIFYYHLSLFHRS